MCCRGFCVHASILFFCFGSEKLKKAVAVSEEKKYPGASPKAGPIFHKPVSLPERA